MCFGVYRQSLSETTILWRMALCPRFFLGTFGMPQNYGSPFPCPTHRYTETPSHELIEKLHERWGHFNVPIIVKQSCIHEVPVTITFNGYNQTSIISFRQGRIHFSKVFYGADAFAGATFHIWNMFERHIHEPCLPRHHHPLRRMVLL